jgi:hypothetical protein
MHDLFRLQCLISSVCDVRMVNKLHGVIGKAIVLIFLNKGISLWYKELNELINLQRSLQLMGFSFDFDNDMLFLVFISCSFGIKSTVSLKNGP